MARNNTRDIWRGVGTIPPVAGGPPRWLLSFVDLTGILVAFFVLMFSMKEPDMQRFGQLQNAMHKAFVPTPAVVVGAELPGSRLNAARRGYQKNDGILYLQQLLERRLEGDVFWRSVRAEVAADAFELPLPPALAADGVLTPTGKEALARLAVVIRNWENHMTVTVHASGNQRWQELPAALVLARELRAAGVDRVGGIRFEAGSPAATALTLRVQAVE